MESWRFGQERAMAPYQLQQAQLGLESGQLGLETGRFNLSQARELAPTQVGSQRLNYLRQLGEFQEWQRGAPLRQQQQSLTEQQTGI